MTGLRIAAAEWRGDAGPPVRAWSPSGLYLDAAGFEMTIDQLDRIVWCSLLGAANIGVSLAAGSAPEWRYHFPGGFSWSSPVPAVIDYWPAIDYAVHRLHVAVLLHPMPVPNRGHHRTSRQVVHAWETAPGRTAGQALEVLEAAI